jgi:hypothetical protein
MLIARDLDVPAWDESVARAAATYLRSRGFKNADVSPGPTVTGTRGSWIGNFTSFDMTRLRARVRLAPRLPGVIAVELDVNTFGQQITDWNRAVWRLEIVELHRVLRGRDPLGDLWGRFHKDARAAARRWAVSFAIAGQRLSEDWNNELHALETELQAPS